MWIASKIRKGGLPSFLCRGTLYASIKGRTAPKTNPIQLQLFSGDFISGQFTNTHLLSRLYRKTKRYTVSLPAVLQHTTLEEVQSLLLTEEGAGGLDTQRITN
jgi:hypothetical protein